MAKIKVINDFINEKSNQSTDFSVSFDLVNGDTITADKKDVLFSQDNESVKLLNAETDEAYFMEYILFPENVVGVYTSLDVDEREDEDEDDDEIEFD